MEIRKDQEKKTNRVAGERRADDARRIADTLKRRGRISLRVHGASMHPWLHAGAVNAQGNPATPLKRVGNSPSIVRAAFPGDAIRFLLLVFSNLHQTSLLKFHRIRHHIPTVQRDAATPSRIEASACKILACSELEQIRRSRSEAHL